MLCSQTFLTAFQIKQTPNLNRFLCISHHMFASLSRPLRCSADHLVFLQNSRPKSGSYCPFRGILVIGPGRNWFTTSEQHRHLIYNHSYCMKKKRNTAKISQLIPTVYKCAKEGVVNFVPRTILITGLWVIISDLFLKWKDSCRDDWHFFGEGLAQCR